MPSSPQNLKAAAWGWRSAVPSWNRTVAVCGPHPTTDEARRFISLCQLQLYKRLRRYDPSSYARATAASEPCLSTLICDKKDAIETTRFTRKFVTSEIR